jgi:acyl-CoA synthetase (AMP-forming)/AMP-acid ligase II
MVFMGENGHGEEQGRGLEAGGREGVVNGAGAPGGVEFVRVEHDREVVIINRGRVTSLFRRPAHPQLPQHTRATRRACLPPFLLFGDSVWAMAPSSTSSKCNAVHYHLTPGFAACFCVGRSTVPVDPCAGGCHALD